jgi:hypothetical protein
MYVSRGLHVLTLCITSSLVWLMPHLPCSSIIVPYILMWIGIDLIQRPCAIRYRIGQQCPTGGIDPSLQAMLLNKPRPIIA